MESEADRVVHVVCGPGVNLNVPAAAFPAKLSEIATSVLAATGQRVDRPAFAADLFTELEKAYDRFLTEGFGALRNEWESCSVLTGRRVEITGRGKPVTGTVVGIDVDGSLRLRTRGGEVSSILSGEVTLSKGSRTSPS